MSSTNNVTVNCGAVDFKTKVTHEQVTFVFFLQIQGLDEENARAVVKLTLGGDVISLNQGALKLVSEKEYSKYSKYLSKFESHMFLQ